MWWFLLDWNTANCDVEVVSLGYNSMHHCGVLPVPDAISLEIAHNCHVDCTPANLSTVISAIYNFVKLWACWGHQKAICKALKPISVAAHSFLLSIATTGYCPQLLWGRICGLPNVFGLTIPGHWSYWLGLMGAVSPGPQIPQPSFGNLLRF